MKAIPASRWALILIVFSVVAAGQEPRDAEGPDDGPLTSISTRDDVDRAVVSGIEWLVSVQDPQTGAFPGKLKNTYTGLSCLALMANGHFPGRSAYGDSLRRGVLYLAEVAEQNDGYLGNEGNARMYGHGICALALTQAYGMLAEDEEDRRVKAAAEQAIQVILQAQVTQQGPGQGGWRYERSSRDADLSVTAWQVLALRSAENCRLPVPAQAITNALSYVRRTYTPKGQGFGYQPGRVTPATRCAGVICMQILGGVYGDQGYEQVVTSGAFLGGYDPSRASRYAFYQSYYVMHAANLLGGRLRETVLPRVERHLLSLQNADGSFTKSRGFDGGVYSSAFSLISLAVRYEYLPIYQD